MSPFEGVVTVERVLSQLEAGCIYSGLAEDGEAIRVRFSGRDFSPAAGDAFHVEGLISVFRDRFGREFRQVDSKRMRPASARGLLVQPWLERLPNLGSVRAARLAAAFGEDLFKVVGDPGRLDEVARVLEPSKPVLAAKIAAQICAAWAAQAAESSTKAAEGEFLAFLEDLGIREQRVASHLWRLMRGADAVERLKRNPYVIAGLVDWKVADRVGRRIIKMTEPKADLSMHDRRLLGAVTSVWREVLSSGDTAATEERVATLLGMRNVSAAAALEMASQRGLLRRAGNLLRAPGAAWLEDETARSLLNIEAANETLPPSPLRDAIYPLVIDAECEVGMQLTDEQRGAVARLLTLPVAVLQGGAGVGKTTVMKVLATAWEFIGGNVVMAALAGKAALTLSRGASTPRRPRLAYTVARLIRMLERQKAQREDPEAKCLEGDVEVTSQSLIVLDEAGMLDTPSLHRLLSLLPNGARVLFAGDQGQLPPIGIGKVFHDLVENGSRVATLTKVLRQASDSAIPVVASMIRRGELPELATWNGESMGVFLTASTKVIDVQRHLRANGETLVVAARRSTVGEINESEAWHRRQPGVLTRRLGPLATIAAGDPVVMTSNRYQDALFNGLLGVVTSIDEREVMITWDGEANARALPIEAEGDIELAYAITCHKAQGSSADAVLVVVEDSHLLTREWLYTAVTRGRSLVVLAGTQADVAASIQRRTVRVTGFALRGNTTEGGLVASPFATDAAD